MERFPKSKSSLFYLNRGSFVSGVWQHECETLQFQTIFNEHRIFKSNILKLNFPFSFFLSWPEWWMRWRDVFNSGRFLLRIYSISMWLVDWWDFLICSVIYDNIFGSTISCIGWLNYDIIFWLVNGLHFLDTLKIGCIVFTMMLAAYFAFVDIWSNWVFQFLQIDKCGSVSFLSFVDNNWR